VQVGFTLVLSIQKGAQLKLSRFALFPWAVLCFLPVCFAATPSDGGPSSATVSFLPDCGKSVDDALSVARKALAAKDAVHDRAALVCLLSAVEMLNAQRLDATRGDASARAHVLAVPKDSENGQ
jgi:hypothetical protein